MKDIFNKIWELALPYQDKREDSGHAATSLQYAQKLVELENADEDVVIPAVILHDVGWSQLPEKRRMTLLAESSSGWNHPFPSQVFASWWVCSMVILNGIKKRG